MTHLVITVAFCDKTVEFCNNCHILIKKLTQFVIIPVAYCVFSQQSVIMNQIWNRKPLLTSNTRFLYVYYYVHFILNVPSPSSLEQERISFRLFRWNLPNSLEFSFWIWPFKQKPLGNFLTYPSLKSEVSVVLQNFSYSVVDYECQILFDFLNFFAFIYLFI